MNFVKLFFRRITKDFKQKQLLPLKLLFFIHASTVFVLYPYLTIHMRELGLNVEETAIMSAMTPIVSIFMPPLAGLIADKIGNFKLLLAIFSGIGGASALLLLMVPAGRVTVIYPNEIVMGVSCSPRAPLSISLHQEQNCVPLHEHPYEVNITMQACGIVCHAVANENDSVAMVNARLYGVQLHDIKGNSTTTVTYKVIPKNVTETVESLQATTKVLQNDERYATAVRKFGRNAYFFPTRSLFNFSCGTLEATDNFACVFGAKDQLNRLRDRISYSFSVGVKQRKPAGEDVAEHRRMFGVEYVKSGPTGHSPLCADSYPKNREYISVNVPLHKNPHVEPYKVFDLGSCGPRCIATSARKTVCRNAKALVEKDVKVTFWSYLAVRVFVGIISSTSFAMFEGAVIAILREHKADYGLQRIYATIGGMISSPLSGWLIDFASRDKKYTDFRPVFFLYASLKIISAILMLFMNLEFKTPAANVLSDIFSVLRKIELLVLFAAVFTLGTAWGYIESFLFWFLQDLGGSKSLMGITITVGGVAGIPLLVLSGPIIKRIGHANVLFVGFLFYGVRLLGYSLIYNPWLCLIFEAMESITSALTFTAAVTYAARLSTITTDTSVQGILGGLYYGVGKGAGSLVGGFLMNAFGTRYTYRIFAAASVVFGLIYFAFNQFYMKHNPSEGRDITKRDSVAPNGAADITFNGGFPHERTIEETLPYEEAFTNMAFDDAELNEGTDKEATQNKDKA